MYARRYGVELQMKNMEYNVLDDKKVNALHPAAVEQSTAESRHSALPPTVNRESLNRRKAICTLGDRCPFG